MSHQISAITSGWQQNSVNIDMRVKLCLSVTTINNDEMSHVCFLCIKSTRFICGSWAIVLPSSAVEQLFKISAIKKMKKVISGNM